MLVLDIHRLVVVSYGAKVVDSEYRKLQVTGGSTMIVSLPRDWVKSNQMKKGDIVYIEELNSGGLHISALQAESSKSRLKKRCRKKPLIVI